MRQASSAGTMAAQGRSSSRPPEEQRDGRAAGAQPPRDGRATGRALPHPAVYQPQPRRGIQRAPPRLRDGDAPVRGALPEQGEHAGVPESPQLPLHPAAVSPVAPSTKYLQVNIESPQLLADAGHAK